MSNYPEHMVAPMRQQLVDVGFIELKEPQQVEQTLNQKGLTLLVVNSVCGCAAAGARPGVIHALKQGLKFDYLTTVFAGMEKEATSKAREYFEGISPTSPQAAILENGQLKFLMQRSDFLGKSPEEISTTLTKAYQELEHA